MGLITRPLELAEDIAGKLEDLWLDEMACSVQAANIRQSPKKFVQEGLPEVNGCKLSPSRVFLYELMASSVNFCYFYGHDKLRPGGASSTLMYSLLSEAWAQGDDWGPALINNFIQKMAAAGFPMMKDRMVNLTELLKGWLNGGTSGSHATSLVAEIERCPTCPVDLSGLFQKLVTGLPGFGEDLFYKRASLFFIQLHRRLGWFSQNIKMIPTPIDYHIPNVLRHLGILKYHKRLAEMVDNREQLPANSWWEIQIRGASLLACNILASKSGRAMWEIDDHLFQMRKAPSTPFHLAQPTAY